MTLKKETPVWEHGGSSVNQNIIIASSISNRLLFVNRHAFSSLHVPEKPSFPWFLKVVGKEVSPGASFLPLRASVGQLHVKVKGLIPTIHASGCVKMGRRIVLVNRRGNQLNLSVSFLPHFRLVSIVTPDESPGGRTFYV